MMKVQLPNRMIQKNKKKKIKEKPKNYQPSRKKIQQWYPQESPKKPSIKIVFFIKPKETNERKNIKI